MDKNYSAWIHNDPDPVDEPVDEEPEPPRVRRRARSVVATGTLVTLGVMGFAVIAASLGTPDTSGTSDSQQSIVEATTADQGSGPGAASIEDEPTADEEWTVEDSTDDESTDDDSTDDDSTDEESTDSWSGSAPEPRLIERRQLRPPMGTPRGTPPGGRRFLARPAAPRMADANESAGRPRVERLEESPDSTEHGGG